MLRLVQVLAEKAAAPTLAPAPSLGPTTALELFERQKWPEEQMLKVYID